MKILFYGTRDYDQIFFDRLKPEYPDIEFTFLESNLYKETASLAAGDMYPEFWTHIYKLGGHHGCFSVFYRRHPFCFCLDSFAIIVINIFINSNCKFFK